MTEAEGWLYDGTSARRWRVTVRPAPDDDTGLIVEGEDRPPEHVPGSELAASNERDDAVILTRTGHDGWQLGLVRPVPPPILARVPAATVYGRWIDRFGLAKFAAIAAPVAAGVLAAAYFAPAWIAPMIPPEWERDFGRSLFAEFEDSRCETPGGNAALAALETQLSPGRDHAVHVVDIPMVNAVALPGGDILIFYPLIARAETPDEVAGVLAHEMGHIEERHVTEAMIRELGFGILIASFGGNWGAAAWDIASLSHSRDHEREADGVAIDRLLAANISPDGLADFFRRLNVASDKDEDEGEDTADEGAADDADDAAEDDPDTETEIRVDSGPIDFSFLEILSTHPLSRERVERFTAASERGGFAPALDPDGWQALRRICGAEALADEEADIAEEEGSEDADTAEAGERED